MKNSCLLSYGEVGLKGKNRHLFIKKLISNIAEKLTNLNSGDFRIRNTYGRIFIDSGIPKDELSNVLKQTFGLNGYAFIKKANLNMDSVRQKIMVLLSEALESKKEIKTFKIAARRSNKNFEKRSSELNIELGGFVLENHPDFKVQMKSPDLTIHLEVREQGIYIYSSMKKVSGGLPVGTSGKGILLLSGGIDSPVAAWLMLKRGMQVQPLHFYSPPYTSIRAKQKVIDLAKTLQKWGSKNAMMAVNFTKVQEEINKTKRKEFITLFIRKAMYKIAENLSFKLQTQALISGENLGQVASQTVESMTATSKELEIPVFRPLIGFDKNEIIKIAESIDTFNISIRPFDDCCTLFLPDKPSTKPNYKIFINEYNKLKLDDLINEASQNVEIIELK